MSALTEQEIFDQLSQSFRRAAELCDELAVSPAKGVAYMRLRQELRLIEGCCKQAAVWREDTRWLSYGLMMAECHKRAGDWLRGFKMPDGTRIRIGAGTLHPCFVKLAENLRALYRAALQLKTYRTGHIGMILPAIGRAPPRADGRYSVPVTAPDGMRRTSGGILIPAAA